MLNIGETITSILTAIRGAAAEVRDAKFPHEIPAMFPQGTLGQGMQRGRFLFKREANGAGGYELVQDERDLEPEELQAELVLGHKFGDLDSLNEWLRTRGVTPEAFITGGAFEQQRIKVPIDPWHPECGTVEFPVTRHPAWAAWTQFFKPALGVKGLTVDLDHVSLADLLLDNAEDLIEPMIAKVIASFRAARTVKYNADLDSLTGFGIQVEWKGSSGGNGEGAKRGDVQVPREFSAKIPVFAGIWKPGEEAKHEMKLRLRVMAPRDGGKDDAAPVFRLTWFNAPEMELEALGSLRHQARAMLGGAVFVGEPSAKRHINVPGMTPAGRP